jgi:hypothetical protein
MVINGKVRSLSKRKFCLECSPWGKHNTSKHPLIDSKTRYKQKFSRYSKKKRIKIHNIILETLGRKCEICGYSNSESFHAHHLVSESKSFGLSHSSSKSFAKLQVELKKCILVCGRCHMEIHSGLHEEFLQKRIKEKDIYNKFRTAIEEKRSKKKEQKTPQSQLNAFYAFRERRKQQCIKYLGNKCVVCGYNKCTRALGTHHRNSEIKEFALSVDNLTKKWETIERELKKCVLVCPNCHAEIHSGRILLKI